MSAGMHGEVDWEQSPPDLSPSCG